MGRIREVFSDPRQIAIKWAEQSQEHARNGRNFHFTGSRIYSYRELEGALVEDATGRQVALLNANHTESLTTKKHIRTIRGALHTAKIPIFAIPLSDRLFHHEESRHANAVLHYRNQAQGALANARTARSRLTYLLGEFVSAIEAGNAYCQAFGLGAPFSANPIELCPELLPKLTVLRLRGEQLPPEISHAIAAHLAEQPRALAA